MCFIMSNILTGNAGPVDESLSYPSQATILMSFGCITKSSWTFYANVLRMVKNVFL